MCYDTMINNINISLVKWSIWMEGGASMAKKRRHIISIILILNYSRRYKNKVSYSQLDYEV